MGTNCKENCPLMCQNGGQCDVDSDEHAFVQGATDFVCDCPTEYRGVLCEELVTAGRGKTQPAGKRSVRNNTGIVVGCFVGIASIALVGIVFKRRHQTKNTAEEELPPSSSANELS
jgi:hypothetical protein